MKLSKLHLAMPLSMAAVLFMTACSTPTSSGSASSPNANLGAVPNANVDQAMQFDLATSDQIYNTMMERLAQTRADNLEGIVYFRDPQMQADLMPKLDELGSLIGGQYSVALMDSQGLVLLRDASTFPLMSVYKFHIAYALFDHLQKANLTLDEKVTITPEELYNDGHSFLYVVASSEAGKGALNGNSFNMPLNDATVLEMIKNGGFTGQARNENIEISLRALTILSLRYSDNIATDRILSYLGGPQVVEQFLAAKGLKTAKIAYTEKEMSDDVQKSYGNSMSTYEAVKSVALYRMDNDLNQEHKDLMDNAILHSPYGLHKIYAGVKAAAEAQTPALSFEVYSKTGRGAMNHEGLRIANNDLAMVNFNGKPYLLAIFAKDMEGTPKDTILKGDEGIREVASTIFSYLATQP